MGCGGSSLAATRISINVCDDQYGNLPTGAMVCPTDGAPFEVFTALSMGNVTGDYWQKNKLHHTANGQADLTDMEEQGYGHVETYHHDLDNTELYFTACDTSNAGYSKWSYARSGRGTVGSEQQD